MGCGFSPLITPLDLHSRSGPLRKSLSRRFKNLMQKRLSGNIIYSVIGILCLAALMLSGRPMEGKQKPETSSTQAPETADLVVLVKPQPDAPLSITDTKVEPSDDPRMPTVQFTITNTTRKRIMAYAIRHDETLPQSTFSGDVTEISPDRNRALQAGAEVQSEITGIRYGEVPTSILLSVDFVEFADGKRWGPDTLNHGEMLDGVRAGVKAAKEVMLEKLEVDGPEVFARSLDAINVEPDSSGLHSSKWLEGFRTGTGWMRERVRSKGTDLIEIRRELRSSFE